METPEDMGCHVTKINDKQPSLEDCYEMLECKMIEVLTLDGGKTQIVIDEEGKLKGKPINWKATAEWYKHLDDYAVLNFDVLVGGVLILTGDARLT